MIIEETDFRLVPINDSSPLFDLELLYEIKPKGKESRLEFKNVAYGITLDYAIKKIAQYRASKNLDNTTLLEYFKEFNNQLKSLSIYG